MTKAPDLESKEVNLPVTVSGNEKTRSEERRVGKEC